MNKKNIQIAVIVIGFLGAGVVLYRGFFGPASSPAPVSAPAATKTANLLPYGNKLDFSVLQSQDFQYGFVQYPQLNTSTDVGVVNLNDLIPPASGAVNK